ncbi:MAG: hypothetical protein ACLRQF_06860 [Thomasclavelia ramosa]
MNPVYVGDESIDTTISGVKAMAIMYSGDAAAVMSENPNMGYYMPKKGLMSGLMDLLFRKSASKQNLQMNLLII